MTIDIRAIVYCNLGKVISGNFSDSYLQNGGVVTTSGSVLLDGIYSPAIGTRAEFAYYKNGVLSRLPRSLKVLSYFADPFRRTTTVEIGCDFTLNSNRKPPPEGTESSEEEKNPTSSEENNEDPCADFNERIVPISSNYIAYQIIRRLGLDIPSPVPLTNRFNTETFDLSSGYVQTLGDLLSSEGYFGRIDENGKVAIENLNSPLSAGPLISADDIIDISPIGVGELPADEVIVNYDSVRLKEPDPATGVFSTVDSETSEEAQQKREKEVQIRDWELDESSQTGGKIYITAWKVIGVVNSFNSISWIAGWTQQDYEFPDYTITESRTEYDEWDRAVKRRTITRRPIAAVNPSYIAARINNVVFNPNFSIGGDITFDDLPTGMEECQEIQEEYFYYSSNPPPPLEETEGSCIKEPPPASDQGFDSLIRKETYKYDSYAKVIASVWQGNYYEPIVVKEQGYEYTDWQIVEDLGVTAEILTEKTVENYEKQEISITVTDADGRPVPAKDVITKQISERYVFAAYKREGQRAIANQTSVSIFSFNVRTVDQALRNMGLLFDSTTVSTAIGRNAFLEARPSRSDRINSLFQKETSTEKNAEVTFDNGNNTTENYAEFNMPYAPDDYIDKQDGQFSLKKSDAQAKALNYGRIQNRLLLGNRYGVSIQISPDLMPPRPFGAIYIAANGIKGQYRVNGTSYTFDQTGVIASTDAVFWGGLR